jgi:hypothetical protein
MGHKMGKPKIGNWIGGQAKPRHQNMRKRVKKLRANSFWRTANDINTTFKMEGIGWANSNSLALATTTFKSRRINWGNLRGRKGREAK